MKDDNVISINSLLDIPTALRDLADIIESEEKDLTNLTLITQHYVVHLGDADQQKSFEQIALNLLSGQHFLNHMMDSSGE